MMSIKTKVFVGITMVAILHYIFRGIHSPKVIYSKNDHTNFVLKRMKIKKYYPIFFTIFFNNYIQFFILIIKEIILKRKYKKSLNQYKREIIKLKDEQNIGLDWLYPKNMNDINDNTPIFVHFYGITGDSLGFNELYFADLITNKLKWIFVIVNRRGHDFNDNNCKLKHKRINLFGFKDDIHESLLYIHKKYENNKIILSGVSAGTGVVVRYLGDICLKKLANDTGNKKYLRKCLTLNLNDKYNNYDIIHNKVLCSINISPGYDISYVFNSLSYPMKKLMMLLINTNLKKNNINIKPKNMDKGFNSLSQFMRVYSTDVSGYLTYEEYLIENNPVTTAKYVNIPGLVLNAIDDPICLGTLLYDWKDYCFKDQNNIPNGILIETKYGSHCCFYNLFANVWYQSIIIDYMKAVFQYNLNHKKNS